MGLGLQSEGLSHGHYYSSDYEGAKQDFAIRSHLIDQNRLFTPEQMVTMYQCGEDTLNYGLDMTYEQEQSIKGVLAQIEDVIPDELEKARQQNKTSDITAAHGLSM